MKDYIKYILSVVTLAFISYYSLVFCAICYKRCVNLQSLETITTAVFGPSTGADSIDDSILVYLKNYCFGGLNYDMEQNFIIAVLEQNPQITTVILCFDPFQYREYPNSKVRHYKPSVYKYYGGFIAFDGFEILTKYSCYELLKLTIGSNTVIEPWRASFGYNKNDRNILHRDIERHNRQFKSNEDIPYEEARSSRSYNLDALNNVISYSQKKGLNVILLSTPMYQLNKWYSRTGYYDFLNTLDEQVCIADYSDFPMPSDDYYGDVIHLNYKGAEYFSKHLKEHGLKAIPVKEYLEQRASGIHARCSD